MQKTLTIETPAKPNELFKVVSNLETYPYWLELVSKVEVDQSVENAYFVTLTAKFGPFARSKRLRMVSTNNQIALETRFIREEIDGRNHSEWKMDVSVEPAGMQSIVKICLSYDGDLWSGPLEAILENQTEQSAKNLVDFIEKNDNDAPSSTRP